MRIYEVTPCSRCEFTGELLPIVTSGESWAREVVAENAGKARMQVWRSIRECYDDFPLGNVKVRSLAKRKAPPMMDGWESRLNTSNAIIRVMAAHGRHFFSENSDRRELVANPFIAHFTVDKQGELWFIDRYTRKAILVRQDGNWRGFSGGGTLRSIVCVLASYITRDIPVSLSYFSPSPEWVCGGDLWGYGNDMLIVRDEVAKLLNVEVANVAD